MLSDKELDAKFEKMSRVCANAMNGTHPPKPKTKTTAKKKVVKRGKKQMNAEHYADPTADKAIAKVMREWRKKEAKKKHGKVSVFDDDPRRKVGVGSKGSAEKHRNEAKEEGNARNAEYSSENAFKER